METGTAHTRSPNASSFFKARVRNKFTPERFQRGLVDEIAVTFGHMTPTDYAATELGLWEQALKEQREAERKLRIALRQRERYRRLNEVAALQVQADLLLAEAVRVKYEFRKSVCLPR